MVPQYLHFSQKIFYIILFRYYQKYYLAPKLKTFIMKVKIEIKHWITGSILFEYETEDNTILKTLKEAVKNKKDLQGAYLRGADLQGADLRGAYLRGADLRGAYLRGADLRGAYLRGADLQGADLQGADLQGADLQGPDLQGAYLRGADLRGAYLRGADLQGADLQGADLQGADLQGPDLQGAYLRGADLQGADLQGADLRGAYLRGADLRGAYLQGFKIKEATVFTGLYDYIVIPFITEENEKRVVMGCYNRSLEEWNSDFWNNENEFPDNGSVKSNLRLMAFETAKKWFEVVGANEVDSKQDIAV